ncbi:hypothetical protein [Rheinheimera salexigens]|uniref:Uncharacterized protein n=1 Tax=Rheinheimera salexigens TaxID=1628148 RepID=A0A1E7Q5P2_9GAMM|nr:hypothetical protein [Rheinheimera salexigens]OEY69393.1 hypothetical protein BI198_07315 [Rheinheimera salexigens]
MKALRSKILFFVFFSIYGLSAHGQDYDIVGLKLGMSVEQVQAALKSYGVDKKNIQERRRYFNYSDGVELFQTDDFVAYIYANRNKDNNFENLSIFFSFGPPGGKVVAITRTIENRTNPLTRSQFLTALKSKYGQPTSEDISTVYWSFPAEKVQCIAGAVGGYRPDQPSILKKIYGANVGSRDGIFHIRTVNSLEQCSSYLTYAMPTGDASPVTTATAVMVDVAGTAEGELSANEWVEGLADKARKEREAKAVKPDF